MQYTDSGGSNTLKALAEKLKINNALHRQYIVASYTLHNIQTCLRAAVLNMMGNVGTYDARDYKKNTMEMIHGLYNIQNYQEDEELKEIQSYAEGLSKTNTF